MHKITEELLEKVNTKLREQPLFYIAKEAERGLGLEKYLENYSIICTDNDRIAQESFVHKIDDSNSSKDIAHNYSFPPKFYVQTFYHSQPTQFHAQNQGGILLNPIASVSKSFEDKISQLEFLSQLNIPIPQAKTLTLKYSLYSDLLNEIGRFVIQLPKGHTGIGTYIISNEAEFNKVASLYEGTQVKITEYIDGVPLTLNGCVTKEQVYVAGLQYQITGLSELAEGEGTTVGNEWSYGSTFIGDYQQELIQIMRAIGNAMRKKGFYGMFGIDCIARDKKIYVIEINARQTANQAMQTKLSLQNDQVPLSLIHLAHFLDIEIPLEETEEIAPLNGAQIFLRSKKNSITINKNITSGVYRLQSDNSALNWDRGVPQGAKPDTIFLDEDNDKPLVYQHDGYSIDDITEGGFLLTVKPQGTVRSLSEEIARMQFNESVMDNNQIAPWIFEAMAKIEELVE